jgi:hypothetical protein
MTRSALLDPWQQGEALSGSTAEEDRSLLERDVFEILEEILGYDIVEMQLMAEGYRVTADESLALAESNIAATIETLPPD